MKIKLSALIVLILFVSSCVDKDIYKGDDDLEDQTDSSESTDTSDVSVYQPYLYPFGNEVQNAEIELTVELDGTIDPDLVSVEIPPLKYNKSWLFLLTQDDCLQGAFSRTWAAINGKPVSGSTVIGEKEYELYYDIAQWYGADIPPGSYLVGKTLGSTDGAGNEVRFHFSTTLAPEWSWMHTQTSVAKGYTDNYYRFFMKSGLIWDNVKEMLNYGTGIAFHDVNTEAVNDPDSILVHYRMAQDSILKNLDGRGCKFLAEPNGNKTYVTAATNYEPIQTITLQSGGTILYPFQVDDDLKGKLVERSFHEMNDNFKQTIEQLLDKPKAERRAVAIGVHGIGRDGVSFLAWLNDTYGKDGDDSVWFPNQEEYFEYNYYRMHGTINTSVSGNTLKITLSLPSGLYFYYPSVTLNLRGLHLAQMLSLDTNDAVTGLSYADYDEGLMVNVDCRKYLEEQAEHYVEVYETQKNESTKHDAAYFVNQLKSSARKEALLERLK
jgi:hypothetical protein